MAELHKDVKETSVDDLTPYPNNPKEHPEEQIDKIAGSIQEFGFTQPIVVDQNNQIIIGHGRLQAAKKIGMENVPVIERTDLTEAQVKALRIADNKVAESGFDDEMLAVELEQLDEADFDLENTGMDHDEMSQLMDEFEGFEVEDPEPEDPDEVETDVEKGDVIKLGRHRLVCGDATSKSDVEKLMDGEKADMVFTDPPYNVAYGENKDNPEHKIRSITNDDMAKDDWIQFNKNFINILMEFNTGDYYIWGASGPDGMIQRLTFIQEGLHWSANIIWHKDRMVLSPANYQRKYEICFYGWEQGEGSSFIADETKKEVWEFDRPMKSEEHPTMKPVELCQEGIQNSCKRGDIVLDVFGGSGSTLLAAEQTERTCYMLELEPKYCQVIINRWEDLTDNEAEVIN